MPSLSCLSFTRQRMPLCRRSDLRHINVRCLFVIAACMLLLAAPLCDAFFDFIFGQYFKFRAPGKMPVGSQYTEESEVDKHGFAIEQLVSPHAVPYKNTTSNLYGIMIDAGSTGSRIQCFNFEWRPVRPYMHLVSDCFGQVTPGLSYYAAYPSRSIEGVDMLIRQIQECIPHRFWHSSPIELKATAGLRLLPFKLADEIMNHISTYLRSTPFVVNSQDAVAIMDGTDEAVYAWISVNYLKRILHESYPSTPPSRGTMLQPVPAEIREQTYGIIDLGGGSTQIAFAPILKSTLDSDPRPFMHRVKVFGESFKLYAYSYLGLGLQSARFRLFGRQEDPNAVMEPTERVLRSSCIHPDAQIPWRHTDSDFILTGLNESTATDSSGGYSFAQCYKEASFLFSSHIRHEDEVPMETFYGLSYLYTKALQAEIIDAVDEAVVLTCDWLDAAKNFCDKDSPLDTARPLMCMDLVIISAMLLDGFGFECNTPIILATRIDSIEVSWSLGAVFHTLNTYHNTSHLHWQRSS